MFTSLAARLAITLLLLSCPLASRATPATVEGSVVDLGKADKKNGISGARIRLIPKAPGGKVKIGLSNASGGYSIADIDEGDYVLRYAANGYMPREPNNAFTLTVAAGKNKVAVIKLMRLVVAAKDPYFTEVGKRVVSHARTSSSPGAYAEFWSEARAANASPTSKARLARAIITLDRSAADRVPGLRAYSDADLSELTKVEQDVHGALLGEVKFPTKGQVSAANLPEEVFCDIVYSELRGGAGKQEQRSAFRRQFLSSWEGSAATKLFLKWEKEEKEKPRKAFWFGPLGAMH